MGLQRRIQTNKQNTKDMNRGRMSEFSFYMISGLEEYGVCNWLKELWVEVSPCFLLEGYGISQSMMKVM